MKRQQVISRFFAAKATNSNPSTSSSSAPARNSPPLPREQSKVPPLPSLPPDRSLSAAATLEWPPRGRRRPLNPEPSPSPSLPCREEDTSRIRGEPSPSKRSGEEEGFEPQPLKKRPRLVRKSFSDSSSHGGNKPQANAVIQKCPSAQESNEFAMTMDDSEMLQPTEEDHEDDHKADDGIQAPNEPLDFPAVQLSSDGEEVAVNDQLTTFEATIPTPNSQQRNAGGTHVQGRPNKGIPASDPAKHKRFVEKLLARTAPNGEVKKPWYGSPPTGKEKLTPLETQVVELKAKYPDVLLMVEVGYRYRFYGDDAETASRTLGIAAYYDHSFLAASIPTFRLHFHVRRLVEAGLKVGVVRQTETAAIKAHGANKAGPFTRGLSALYTRATIEAVEDLGGGAAAAGVKTTRLNSYLMCIVEMPMQGGKRSLVKKGQAVGGYEVRASGNETGAGGGSFDTEFGVVAIETATGDVMFGNFNDTVVRTELEGRLITCSPAELLLANPLSSATEKLLHAFAGPASEVRVERVSRDCFKDGGALAEVVDFYAATDDQETTEESNCRNGLEVIMGMPDIVVQALALVVRYLRQFNLEKVLRLGAIFRPFSRHDEMKLSPNSLRQLEILNNSTDGSARGSLLWLMDHTQTAFGARLLRYWVTHPLCDHTLIAARQDAVAEIAKSMGALGSTSQLEGSFPSSGKGGGAAGGASRGRSSVTGRSLQQGPIGGLLSMLGGRIPDLERGLTRMFHRTATTSEFVSVIQTLVTSAQHFQRLQFGKEDPEGELEEEMGDKEFKTIRSLLLQRLISAVSSATLCQHATRLLSALNLDAATAGDKLSLFNCADGRFPEVANCRHGITAAEMELDEFLPTFRKLLRNPKLEFISINGLSHLVEAPVAQRVPANWIKVNGTKKVTRYHPPEVLESRDKLALAKEELALACARAWEMFLAEFSSHYVDFRASVQALASLDCLHSLALLSRNQGYIRPEFVGEAEPSQLMIEAGRHPILDATLQGAFVPNDTFMGGGKERCQIITGPNMGGKSCYIRQVALIAIMAQVGSFVPAASAKLHVFDSVQTRMGASDSLQRGASTFFEELSETSTILRTATSRSLIILDELGRGTSTHDGVAIAFATLQHLLQETKCLTLFVTHYPKIAELKNEFQRDVNPYYVSYMTDDLAILKESAVDIPDQVAQSSEVSQTITFLYKLVPGVASKSFGLHVARLAKVPEACVLHAARMATMFEEAVSSRNNKARFTAEHNDGSLHQKGFRSEEVDANHFRDSGELSTTAAACEGIQPAGSDPVEGSALKPNTGDERSNGSLALKDGSCPMEPGHDSRTERRKCIAESELQELLLSLKNALKYEDAEKLLSFVKDVQTRVREAIS